MTDPRRIFGNAAERDAAAFLKSRGMKLLEAQYQNRFGEIDIIAKDGEEFVMVEVKARHGHGFGYPEESVTTSKIRKITTVAEHYMASRQNVPWRIDVIAIEYDQSPPNITHIVGVG